MLLFHQEFCEYVFTDSFNFLLTNDPYFGSGTFGQLGCFMAERICVIDKHLSDLEDGGWTEKDAFKAYKTALKGIPDKSDSFANKEFFDKLAPTMIWVFRQNLDKHVFDHWRSDPLLHYMIGGDPTLAKEFAKLLVQCESDSGESVEEEDGASLFPRYVFPDTNIELGEHHTMGNGAVEINVRDSMKFLTANSDLSKILKGNFVKEHWALVEKLATADDIVRLFDKLDDGELSAYCCYLQIYNH